MLQAAYEEGAYWRKGSKDGPAAIVSALGRLRPHSLRSDRELLLPIGEYLAPPLEIGPYDRSAAFEKISQGVAAVLGQGRAPVTLGGDHSVSYPIIRAVAEHFGPGSFGILHIDAHSDTFPAIDGYDYHHGAVFRKIVEDRLAAPGDIHQLGLRGMVPSGSTGFAAKQGLHLVSADELRAAGLRLDSLGIDGMRPWYVSIDIDSVDPAFAPGTGTPVPGGLTSAELLELIEEIARLPLVGLDLVEVAPVYDPAGITVLLAAHAVMEILICSPFISAEEARAW